MPSLTSLRGSSSVRTAYPSRKGTGSESLVRRNVKSLFKSDENQFEPQIYLTSPLHESIIDLEDVSVGEVMIPHPLCFKAGQSIKEAARLMIEKDIRSGPVIDNDGKLLGLLTESDMLWKGAGVPEDHFLVPPIFIGAFDLFFYLKDDKAVEAEVKKILARKVADAMTKDPISVQPELSMAAASRLMLRRKIHDLPVTEADGRLVGMISRHDVLRALIASHSLLLE